MSRKHILKFFSTFAYVVTFCTITFGSISTTPNRISEQSEKQIRFSNGVPQSLLNKLYNGVNVTRWFCYLDSPTDYAHTQSYFTQQDWRALNDLHVTFVRLCISPEFVYNDGQAIPKALECIDDGLKEFHKHHIVVIWDLHDNGQLKLDATNANDQPFIKFWKSIATHYKGEYENSLVFELVNEPVFQHNADKWYALQSKTVSAIRSIDPSRTLLCTDTNWSSIDQLSNLKPLKEKNIIYTVHCYDPFVFTHQGATWVGDQQKALKEIPFPSSEDAVAKMIHEIPKQFQDAVIWYGKQHYDASYLMKRMEIVREWANNNHVPIILGEFGAYPPVSPPNSRKAWFMDMYQAITENHLPHAVWGYDDSMGLGRKILSDKEIKLDSMVYDVIKAYGSKGKN